MYQNQYNNLTAILADLNVSSISSSVYEYFLVNTNNSITNCGHDLGVYRHQVYSALEELQNTGLIKSQNKKIVVESPQIIGILLEHKSIKLNSTAQKLDIIIPKLNGDYSNQDNGFVKTYFRKNQLLKVVQNAMDKIKKDQIVLIFGESEEFYNVIEPLYLEKTIVKKRIIKRIQAKLILVPPVSSEVKKWISKDKEQFRETRILEDKCYLVGTFWVLGDKVILWNTETNIAITIENSYYARMFTTMFELVWKNCAVSKEYKTDLNLS